MESVYLKIAEAINKRVPSWLVTVSEVTGSTPATVGMKMLVYSDSKIEGTIGGGEIEKKVIDKIVRTLPGKIEKCKFDLGAGNDSAESTDMICGGTQEVIIEPLLSGAPLYIIGGGHCGMALSNLAGKTGFLVTVIDDRAEWASFSKHPGAVNVIKSEYTDVESKIKFSKDNFIVIMTQGHKHDSEVLEKLVDRDFKYLGMIGSGKKVKTVLEGLLDKGTSEEKIKNVFTPIGLDITTHTPDEIAVSIVAQMIAVKNNKTGIIFNQNPLLTDKKNIKK